MQEGVFCDKYHEYECNLNLINRKFNRLNILYEYDYVDFRSYGKATVNDIKDISNKEEIIKWVNMLRSYPNEKLYDSIIERAIKNNLPEIIDVLHKGKYFCVDSFPNYSYNLKIASEFANLETFQLMLHNFFIGFNPKEWDLVSKKEFDKLIELNPYHETKDWIKNNIDDIYDVIEYRVGNKFYN